MLVVSIGHAADMNENDPLSESKSDDARHRIDMSAIFPGSVSSDSLNGSLGYTYNLTSNSNFTAVLPSLDSIVSGADLRVLTADVGIGYVGLNGFWASYFPQFLRDLKSNDWAINHRLAVGKMFTPLFGVGVDYSFIERYTFGSTLPIDTGFDQQIELTINLTF
jgi:hypothetical protein